MKTTRTPSIKSLWRRDTFTELTDGMAALAEAREGRRMLRTHAAPFAPAPKLTPEVLLKVRESPPSALE